MMCDILTGLFGCSSLILLSILSCWMVDFIIGFQISICLKKAIPVLVPGRFYSFLNFQHSQLKLIHV